MAKVTLSCELARTTTVDTYSKSTTLALGVSLSHGFQWIPSTPQVSGPSTYVQGRTETGSASGNHGFRPVSPVRLTVDFPVLRVAGSVGVGRGSPVGVGRDPGRDEPEWSCHYHGTSPGYQTSQRAGRSRDMRVRCGYRYFQNLDRRCSKRSKFYLNGQRSKNCRLLPFWFRGQHQWVLVLGPGDQTRPAPHPRRSTWGTERPTGAGQRRHGAVGSTETLGTNG